MPWSKWTVVPSCLCVTAPCVLQKLELALKSALKSHLEDACLALLMTPAHFDAYLLRKAMKVNISSVCTKYQRRTVLDFVTPSICSVPTGSGLRWRCPHWDSGNKIKPTDSRDQEGLQRRWGLIQCSHSVTCWCTFNGIFLKGFHILPNIIRTRDTKECHFSASSARSSRSTLCWDRTALESPSREDLIL